MGGGCRVSTSVEESCKALVRQKDHLRFPSRPAWAQVPLRAWKSWQETDVSHTDSTIQTTDTGHCAPQTRRGQYGTDQQRGATGQPRRRGLYLPTTVSTSFSMSARMYIRPRRSVWSVPHRLGTFITQRLCTFIIQAAGQEEREGGSALLSPRPKLAGCSEGVGSGQSLSSF